MIDQPRRVGGWKIVTRLGAGGMGSVYLGSRGKQRAAIKVVHPGLASDRQFRDRFRREVAISRRVDGPHVASVVDADTEADLPWLAIEFVPGPTLAQQVAEHGPLDAPRTLATAVALAAALREIHGAGVHHRDLKPTNVILAPTGPVVIDFGIAGAADSTSLTQTGAVMGSTGWMAPEQVRGDPSGAPADVFSWAATVCFAATGRSPFGTGRADAVAYRVAHVEPDLTGVSDELLPAMRSCLAKEPDKRPDIEAVLDELAAALESDVTVVDGSDVTGSVTALWTPVTGTTAPGPKRAPRHGRWIAVAAVIAAALLAGGVAVALGQAGDDGGERTAAGIDPTSSTTERPSSTAPATTVPASTSTSSLTTTSTTAPPATSAPTTTAPADPSLEQAFDPANDAHIADFIAFAEAHLQQIVRLNVSWDAFSTDPPSVDAQPEWEPGTGLLYAKGACPDDPFCGGMEVLVNDLGATPDANLYYDSGSWVLSGRFAVQGVTVGTGGVMSVSLRAVPAG